MQNVWDSYTVFTKGFYYINWYLPYSHILTVRMLYQVFQIWNSEQKKDKIFHFQNQLIHY